MNADTIDEFLRSYKEGFFGLTVGGKIYPARLVTREVPRGVLAVQYMADDRGNFLSQDIKWDTEKDRLIRGYPNLGYVKVGPTAGYVRVLPLRQFQKGYVPGNATIYIPNQSQIRKINPRFVGTTQHREVVWRIFTPEYWHPNEAVRLMDDGEGVGYPLSSNFALFCHSEHPNPIIAWKNKDVGVYRNGRFELFNRFDMLREEFARETKVECAA